MTDRVESARSTQTSPARVGEEKGTGTMVVLAITLAVLFALLLVAILKMMGGRHRSHEKVRGARPVYCTERAPPRRERASNFLSDAHRQHLLRRFVWSSGGESGKRISQDPSDWVASGSVMSYATRT